MRQRLRWRFLFSSDGTFPQAVKGSSTDLPTFKYNAVYYERNIAVKSVRTEERKLQRNNVVNFASHPKAPNVVPIK
jgi:hypothetical protein